MIYYFDGKLLCLFVFIFCGFCVYNAQKKNNIKYLWISIIVLSLFAGFRDITVGLDTISYTKVFSLIESGNINLIYGFEKSFLEICKFLLNIFSEYKYIYTFFAFITYGLCILRFWDFRKKYNLLFIVFYFLVSYYFYSINVMRQFVSISIIFFSTRYLDEERRSYSKFILLILFASLFHLSAILGVGYLLIDVLNWKKLSKSQKNLYIFLGFLIVYYILFQGTLYEEKYNNYFENIVFDIGIVIFAKYIYLFFITYLNFKSKNKFLPSIYSCYYFIGLSLTFFGYLFPFMDRTGLYFMIYEPVIFSALMINNKNKKIFFLINICWLIIVLIMAFASNSHGQFPYILNII